MVPREDRLRELLIRPRLSVPLFLGPYTDGVIYVSVLGQTHREALRVYRKSLENVGGRMIRRHRQQVQPDRPLRLLQVLPLLPLPVVLLSAGGRGAGARFG